MRRIKRKIGLICLLATLTMSSCDFSETCSYVGKVEVLLDWDALWKHLPPTEKLTAVLYDEQGKMMEQVVERGTALTGVSSGELRLLVYNPATGIELKEVGGAYPELQQATFYYEEELAVEACPMVCVGTGELKVPTDETVYPLVEPRPVVKQLTLRVTVLQKSGAEVPVSAQAALGGVCTGYSISDKAPVGAPATVLFSLTKEKDGVLMHRFNVLGISPKGEHLLNLLMPLESGEIRVTDFDLNKVFSNFTKDILHCEITVDATVSPARAFVGNVEQEKY